MLAAPPLAPRRAVVHSGRQRPAARSNRPPNRDAPGQATRAPRVLLVDDHPGMRGVLEDAGIQVVGEAADGLEGVVQAKRSVPMWC